MKIFVLTCLYPNIYNPIAGNFVRENCDLLVGLGHQVTVLDASAYNPIFWLKHFPPRIEPIEDTFGSGCSFHRLGCMDTRLPWYAVASFRYCAKALYDWEVKKNGKPDLLLAHFSFPAGFVAREISLLNKIPFAVVEHYSFFLRDILSPYIRHQLRRTIMESATFVCVSNELKNSLVRHIGLKNKIQVIPNAISPIFSYVPSPLAQPFVFFCAGGTKPSKRTRFLIEAFHKAFPPEVPVKLVIAGPGSDWGNLFDLTVADSRICLVGLLSRAEMLNNFVACHCYVMPSDYETFGIVYREAMAVGRPVISTKNGGVQENWMDSFGILVERDDIDGLIFALRKMYIHYDLYNGKAISEECLTLYSFHSIAKKFNEVLGVIKCKTAKLR